MYSFHTSSCNLKLVGHVEALIDLIPASVPDLPVLRSVNFKLNLNPGCHFIQQICFIPAQNRWSELWVSPWPYRARCLVGDVGLGRNGACNGAAHRGRVLPRDYVWIRRTFPAWSPHFTPNDPGYRDSNGQPGRSSFDDSTPPVIGNAIG